MLQIKDAKGFNYQPSYAHCGNEIWWQFDAAVFEKELGRGKKFFPKMNAVRIWLAWDVFALGNDNDKDYFIHNFNTVLGICNNLGIAVMPVLFNRWHSGMPDWGGVYLDHFVPGQSSANKKFDERCREYINGLMSRFGKDQRIFCWDLCNEPFFYNSTGENVAETKKHEQKWLESIYEYCKGNNPEAPVSVGFIKPFPHLIDLCHISDVYNFHFYSLVNSDREGNRRTLDDCVELAEKKGKQLIVTETCWGSLLDEERVELIDFTLSELNARRIPWLAYLLHHSLVSDAHRPEFGSVGQPGHMEFIEADGSLRVGHDIINRFF